MALSWLDEHLSEETQRALETLGVTLLGPHGNYLYKAKFPLDMTVIERVMQFPYVEWFRLTAHRIRSLIAI